MLKPKYGIDNARGAIQRALERDPSEVRPQDLDIDDFIALFTEIGPLPEQRSMHETRKSVHTLHAGSEDGYTLVQQALQKHAH